MSHPRGDILFDSLLSSFRSCCHKSPTVRSLAALLLAFDRCATWSLSGPRVGVSSLAPNRQAASVTQPSVTAEVHKSLDVERHIASEVTLDTILIGDELTDSNDLLVG